MNAPPNAKPMDVSNAKMKRLLIILTLWLVVKSSGQTHTALEKALTKELPQNSTTDGRWVFYPEKANVKKIEKPLVKAIIPDYSFYNVTLTNYLGWHINQGRCFVLFDSSKSKIVLVEPLWYGDVSKQLTKLFIGKKFQDQQSLLNCLSELYSLMQVGSSYKFRETSQTDSLITYDLGYFKGDSYTTGSNGTSSTINYTDDGVWRKIKIDIKDFAIIRYTAVSPVTNDKKIIQ